MSQIFGCGAGGVMITVVTARPATGVFEALSAAGITGRLRLLVRPCGVPSQAEAMPGGLVVWADYPHEAQDEWHRHEHCVAGWHPSDGGEPPERSDAEFVAMVADAVVTRIKEARDD